MSANVPPALRILIIDDNEDCAISLAMLLGLYGYQADVEHDGTTVLSHISDRPYDVYVLDIGLPGADGWKIARTIRDLAREPRPTVIAVTGYGSGDARQKSRDNGIDFHFTKPLDSQMLDELLLILNAKCDCLKSRNGVATLSTAEMQSASAGPV